jgi:Putative bacterial sensory transduction regulator
MISLPKAILFIVLLALAPPAAAQPVLPGTGGGTPSGGGPGGLIGKITAQQLAKIVGGLSIDGKPLQTSIKTFDDNTAVVVLPLWGDDLYSGVLTEFCEKDGSGCHTLHFFANFGKQQSVDSAWMDAYNRTYVGVKVYTLDNGELVFTYDLPLFSGVSQDYLLRFLSFYKGVVDEAFKFKPK